MEANGSEEQAAGNDRNHTSSEVSSSTSASHHEDRLSRTWRHLISSVFHATSKAEQLANAADVASIKEIDDAVVAFLRARLEWGRNLSFLEAKLEGKAKEMEVLQHYSRTQPCLGFRKRKREKMERKLSMISQTTQTSGPPEVAVGVNPGDGENQPTSTL